MLTVKVPRNKLYHTYLEWINPILKLSKGEMDILSTLLQLQYAHKYYPKETLNELLFSDQTKEHIRKRLKINKRLFDKLYKSLEEKGLISEGQINPAICKYPQDNRLKLFIAIECVK
jgi:hypothetical protein